MQEQSGFKTSILIPLSRYQQLLKQYQNPSTNRVPSPQKLKRRKLSSNDTTSSSTDGNASEVSENEKKSRADEASHVQLNSAAVLSSDDKEAQLARKLMHTIKSSFSKAMREKITRLLLFILNFGSHVLTINQNGNVWIRNRIVDPASNIVDLLRASVSVTVPKPVGFKEFRKALTQINVPQSFLLAGDENGGRGNKDAIFTSVKKANRARIKKWETL